MEVAAIVRMFASLGLILGLLAAALWAVRRFDLRLPGRSPERGRLQLVERLSLDPKCTLVLIRRDDREHLLLIGPEALVRVESLGVADRPASAPDKKVPVLSFGRMLDVPATPGGIGRLGLVSIEGDELCVAD